VRRNTGRALAIVLIATTLHTCAQATLPPGGPPDAVAPQLLRVAPESGSVRAQLRDVVFQFDEVVSERPSAGATLAQVVFISPSSGEAEVRWRRSSLAVRPRGGWRENTTYVVTLLPGVVDLRGNARDSTTILVFSTGDSIPNTRFTGVVFDWLRAAPAPRALVQARPADDSTLVYYAEADSVGRFLLPFLAPGTYIVRAIIDGNRNRALDPRELWDTVRVTLRDAASAEFYAFANDSAPPRISSVTVVDSLTLRVALDGPVSPTVALAGIADVFTPDSVPLAVTRVVPWATMSAERAERDRVRRDSVERADTSSVARAARDRRLRDSLNRAAAIADSAARDSTPRTPAPRASRPALVTEIGIQLGAPPVPGTTYRVRLRLTGVLGGERDALSSFSRARPDSTPPAVRRDTATGRR